ncbi:hypothetical protein OK016_28645 [Vibrio chagasii]|nr:hypothetical protein [Vibrio chagasii]
MVLQVANPTSAETTGKTGKKLNNFIGESDEFSVHGLLMPAATIDGYKLRVAWRALAKRISTLKIHKA